MAINENQFFELEKRIQSFKASLGVANTTSGKQISNEFFAKPINVYSDDIITNSDQILKTNSSTDGTIKPKIIRTWVTASLGGGSYTPEERLARGYFSSSNFDGTGANPFVEKIICPLVKIAGTNGQAYSILGYESASSAYYSANYTETNVSNITEYNYAILAQSQSSMLNNFISPFKFGLGYKAEVYASNTTIDQGDIFNSNIIISNDNLRPGYAQSPPEYGGVNDGEGWIFDYKTGIILFGAEGPTYSDGSNGSGNYPDLTPKPHPLWIKLYRYIGPTGFSHPDAIITASALQVNNDIQLEGNLTASNINASGNINVSNISASGDINAHTISIDGFAFSSATTLVTSASTIFGNEQSDTHQFTGSVNISGGLFTSTALSHSFTGSVYISGGLYVDGENTSGGGTGAPGIVTSIFPNPSSSTEHGNYNKTTLFPTDTNDIVEYKADFGLELSSSLGTSSYVILFGSQSSAEEIKTLPDRTIMGNSSPIFYTDPSFTTFDFTDIGTINYDLFAFTGSESGKDYPILSSYAPFTASNTSFTTHSFELSSSKVIPKISIYYSRNQETLINPLETASIEAIQFSGSNNGSDWTGLYEEINLINKESSSRSGNPIEGGTFEFLELTIGQDPEFPPTDITPTSQEQNLLSGTTKLITKYTTNNFATLGTNESYKFYKLHISGGYFGVGLDGDYVQYLHHIDIFEDLNITGSNRKQININFDSNVNPDTSLNPDALTNFQFAVSNSLAAAGLVIIEPADNAVIAGIAQQDLDINEHNLNNVNLLDSTTIENSGNIITNGIINTGSLIQSGGIYLGNTPPTAIPSGSIILESLNPIFFTNKASDNETGVDQFSGRIFGHYTDNNVSDLYIDAYRLYNISDVEQRIQTLNPTEGLIHLTSSNIHLQGEVTASNISSSGIINASGYRLNGDVFTAGGGSGFPHDQNSNANPVTASITGSLKIGEDTLDELTANPHIILNNAGEANHFLNQNTGSALYNYDGNLYWGSTLVVDATADTLTSINNGTLTGTYLDLNGQGILGSGNIIINGTISSSDNISTDGMVSASGNIITNGIVSASEMSASTFYGVFDGAFSSSAQITTDGSDTLISGASQITALGFSTTDNDTQGLSLNGTILSLTNGGTVNLSSIAGDGGGGTGAGFPFIGDAAISGSLGITGDNIGPGGPLDIVDTNVPPSVEFTSSLTPEGGASLILKIHDGNTSNATVGFEEFNTATFLSTNIVSALGLSLDYNFYAKFGYTPIINSVDITYYQFSSHKRPQISGSNDGVNWEGIAQKSTDFELEIPLTNSAQVDTFSFTNTTPYKWYRLFFDVENLHQNPNPVLDPNDLSIYELNYTSTIDVNNTGSLTVDGIYGNLYGTASYAPDNLWHDVGTTLTSSKGVWIKGDLKIHTNKHIILDEVDTFQNNNGILNIGNTNNQYDQISFKIETDTPVVIKNNGFTGAASANCMGIGTDTPTKTLTVKGDISASGDLFVRGLTKDDDNGYAPVVWNSATGQFFTTSSDAFGGDIINNYTDISNNGTLWSTSSVDGSITSSLNTNVRISGSLFVQNHLEIFDNSGKNHISIGTTDTSKTLNVSGSVLISNVKDDNNPDSEGILMESYGDNNATISNIFLKQTSDGKYGTQLFRNGSNVYDSTTQTHAGAFGIINHNNNTIGTPIITILQDGKLGLHKGKPDYDVHVGEFTFFDKNVAIASPNSMSVGAGIKSPTALAVEGDISASGNLYLNGAANIQGFAFESTTALVTSASTIFGNEQSDTHQFTGSVFLNNNLTVDGKLYATSSWATNTLTASYIEGFKDNDWLVDDTKNRVTSSRDVYVGGDITASGHISASGHLYARLPENNHGNIVTYNTSSGQLEQQNLSTFTITDSESLSVSPIDESYSCSVEMIKVQQDGGNICENNPGSSTNNDVAGNSGSLVDGIENIPYDYFKIYPRGSGTDQDAANIIFNFKEPVIVSEFRQRFYNNDSTTYLPKNVKIYGQNSPFEEGAEEGTLLAQGAKPHPYTDGGIPLANNLVSQDPFGEGTIQPLEAPNNQQANIRRTSSITETSLTSSFQYYRLRYSGSFPDGKGDELGTIFQEITPFTRSFTQGTTTSFNDGVIEGEQIVVNNLEGTASYATFAETTNNAVNGFPFSGSAVISGSLSVSGNVSFHGNLDMNNYSIENINNIDAISANIGYLESNQIVTTTLSTNTIEVGTLPSSTPPSGSINTTGPIIITSIITGSTTQSYDDFEILSVQKRQGLTGVYWDNLYGAGGKLKLTSSNFAFTSGSTQSLVDTQTATSIIVNQNTLGTYTVPSPGEGPYPLYPLSTNDVAIEVHQTNSFFVKFKFPEPVLIDSFEIDFPSEGGTITGYDYTETSMSLDGTQLFTNADDVGSGYAISGHSEFTSLFPEFDPALDNINVIPNNSGVGNWWFTSNKLGVLVDDSNFNFLYEGTNDDPYEIDPDFATFVANTGLPLNHRGVVFGAESTNGLSAATFDITNPEGGLHIGYDFGEGNETIIHKYQIHQYKNHMITDMVFEACNDTSSGDWTLIDVNMNITTYENVVNGLYTTVQTFDPQNSLNPITTRDNSNFQNTTPFRFYRFRFLGGETSFFKIGFFEATEVTEGEAAGFNPEYISIYSNQEGEGDQGTGTIYAPFAYYPGTFKGTTTIDSTDTEKTISLETFNNANGNPLSKYYTIEFSGSHNPNNFAGVAEIQPVTRSFTTQSIIIGSGSPVFPGLPEGFPQNTDCSNASVVYYDVSTGTFYYTSSCGGDTGTDNTFDTISTNILEEKDIGGGITLSSSLKIVPSTLPTHSEDDGRDFGIIVFDTSSGELKSLNQKIVVTAPTIKSGSFEFVFPNGEDRREPYSNPPEGGPTHTPNYLTSSGYIHSSSLNLKTNPDFIGSRNITLVSMSIKGDLDSNTTAEFQEDYERIFNLKIGGQEIITELDEALSDPSSYHEIIPNIGTNVTASGITFPSSLNFNTGSISMVNGIVDISASFGNNVNAQTFPVSLSLHFEYNVEDITTDGDIISNSNITSLGGTFGNVHIIEDEIKPSSGSKLDIKADTIKPSSGSKLNIEVDKIIPPDGKRLTLGDRNAPIDEMHIKRGTIYFYSSSDAYSSSLEVARMTINSSSNEIEFKTGSSFNKIRASEINLGTDSSAQSVQIGQSTQGFIAVNAEPGKYSTIFRAEHTGLSGDQRMGSITQQGSGSFAILLDGTSPGIRPDAKFAIYSNTAIPGIGTQLFTVSESFETRIHNGGLKADNYVTTTNITASGNISASGAIIANSITSSNFVLRSQKSILAENLAGAINKTIVTNLADSGLTFGDTSISTTLQGSNISTQVGSPINLNGNITASGNISGSHITTASFGSLQLSNLPTNPTGLPTGSVWVSGSKNDASTSNVNCGTLMIVI